MSALRVAWSRVSGLFKRNVIERDMHKEMQFHLDMLVQELESAGMSAQDARNTAKRRFGNLTRLQEQGREIRGGGMLEEFGQDLHYGIRMLRRSPAFAALAILCLTVGIGANAAVYSWIEGVLLRPYPLVANQDR